MATVPATARTMQAPIAWRAFLADVPGVAMKTTDGVFFIDDATGLWQELTRDTAAADLVRLGQLDLIEAARIADGEGYAYVLRRAYEHARVAA